MSKLLGIFSGMALLIATPVIASDTHAVPMNADFFTLVNSLPGQTESFQNDSNGNVTAYLQADATHPIGLQIHFYNEDQTVDTVIFVK